MSAKQEIFRDLIFLVVVSLLVFCYYLGQYPLQLPDEARYAEIAREMWLTKDFIVPHLQGLIYIEKPIFFYWISSLSIGLFGVNEFAVRLPIVLFSISGLVSLYCAIRYCFDRNKAITACLILATSIYYFSFSHALTLDMPVSTLIGMCLLAFICHHHSIEQGSEHRSLLWLMYVFMAFAVLTKGLMGIVLPGLVISLWLITTRQYHWLLKLKPLHGLFILFLINAPWHWAVAQQVPEFFQFYFIEQHLLRYITDSADRVQPFWYFVPVLILGLFPWTFLLPKAISTYREEQLHQQKLLFFVIWAVSIFCFFTLSKSKLITYMLPLFMPIAVVLAFVCEQTSVNIKKYYRRIFIGVAGIGFLFGVLTFFLHKGIVVQHVETFRLISFTLFLAGIIGYSLLSFEINNTQSVIAIASTCLAIYLPLMHVVGEFNKKSSKQAALYLRDKVQADEDVVCLLNNFYDLSFYLNRRIYLTPPLSNELHWSLRHTPSIKLINGESEFREQRTKPATVGFINGDTSLWSVWNDRKTKYLVIEKKRINEFAHVTGHQSFVDFGQYIVVTNQDKVRSRG